MRLPRVQFTIRWLMASIFLASLVFATVVARREQQRMVPVLNALEASYQNAKLTREVAEIAVMEYADGTYKQDRETLTDLERANARQEWLDQMRRINPYRSVRTPLIGSRHGKRFSPSKPRVPRGLYVIPFAKRRSRS